MLSLSEFDVTVMQSSIYSDDVDRYGPSNALDGDRTANIWATPGPSSYTHAQIYPWWMVDLGQIKYITHIVLFGSTYGMRYWTAQLVNTI